MTKFKELIKEICDEKNIEFKLLSKDWIVKLKRGDVVRYIVGMKFPLNNYSSSVICNDKYAMYHVLKSEGIPVIEHKLLYRNGFTKKYKSDLINKKEIVEYLNDNDVLVVKDTCGLGGRRVYLAHSYPQVKKYLNRIFKRKDTAVINPFVNIESEYRLICLSGKVEVAFEKKRKEGEWRHNLAYGASVRNIQDENELKNLESLALKVMKVIGIEFASVDIVKVDGSLMVLEVNASVSMNKYSQLVPNGHDEIRRVFTKAIEKMME